MIHAPLLFHLQHDMLQHFLLVLVQLQLIRDQRIPFHKLGCRKPAGQAGRNRMVLDKMADGMQRPVHRSAVILGTAEILPQRTFLIPGYMNGMAHQLVHTLVPRCRDRHDRHAQHGFHGVHIHGAAVAPQLIHHVQRHHHGNVHFQQLHGQIQVALDVGGIHDIDNGFGFVFQNKVPGNQLLAGIGRHGIDTGQVGDPRIIVAPYDPILPVHRNTRKIAHMLVCACQLIKQGGLAAVLIADQRKSQNRTLRQGIPAAFGMEAAFLTQSGMLRFYRPSFFGNGRLHVFQPLYADPLRIGQTQRQFIAVDLQLHRIAHGSIFDHGHFRTRNDPHIQKMLTQGTFPAHSLYPGRLSRF